MTEAPAVENQVKVSVVIPTFNRVATIQRAIDSVLSQTFTNFELIVVDDGSTDETAEIVSQNHDQRIIFIRSSVNQGSAATRNIGVSKSSGDILCFLDSDDVWLCTFLERVVDKLENSPDVGFVYTLALNGPLWTLEGSYKYAEALRQGYISATITLGVRRDAFLRVGGFDPSLRMCDDDDLCFKLAKDYSFALITEPLAVAVGSEDSISRGRLKNALGWERLYSKYKCDIIKFCGNSGYATKLFDLSKLFLRAGKRKQGLLYLFLGLRYAFRRDLCHKGAFRGSDISSIVKGLVMAYLSGLRRQA